MAISITHMSSERVLETPADVLLHGTPLRDHPSKMVCSACARVVLLRPSGICPPCAAYAAANRL